MFLSVKILIHSLDHKHISKDETFKTNKYYEIAI